MTNSLRQTTTATLLLLLAGCAAQDADLQTFAATIDTLPGGVIRVTNPGPTLWAGDSGWHFTEGLTIAPAEGSPGELSDVRGVTTDAAGNVYVLQSSPTTIKVFGPDGTWLRDIGREGDGPGEFRDGMLGLIGDTLLVQDPNNTRLTTFLTDGTFLASHPSQCCWFSSSVLPTFSNGTVAISGPPPGTSESPGALYMMRADGVVVDTVMIPSGEDDPGGQWVVTQTRGNNRSMMSIPVPGRPQDLTKWRPDGMMVSGNTARYEIALSRAFTDTVRLIVASAPQLTLTDTERDSLFDEKIAIVSEEWRDAFMDVAKRSDIPDTRPLWSAIATDDQNRIWVGLPGPLSDVDMLEVFSPEGVLLGRMPSPAPNFLRGTFIGDRVVLESEDDLGLPRIRTFNLVRSLPE